MSEAKDPSQLARKRLSEACRTKDTSKRLAWAITIGEGVLLGIACVALADYWLMLPVWMRTVAAAVLGLVAMGGLYRLIRFFRRPTPLKEAALDLEATRPELGCEVSTAAEYLSGERQVTREYEAELVNALEARAADGLTRSSVAYERRLLWPAVVLGVTLVALGTLLLLSPGSWTALARAALPFSKARYTQVDVKPGNVEIPVGRDLEITNHFTGRAPKNPRFYWQSEGETEWHSSALETRDSDGAYLYSFHGLRSPVKYRVTGNDADSGVLEIKTFVPPEVKDLSVEIQYPDYTHLQPSRQTTGDISAVRASTVQIQVEPSVKLAEAKVRLATTGEEVPLQAAADGTWTGSFKLTKDTDYVIELADQKGHRAAEAKPHHIKALPDSAPKVEIEDPGQDMRASATNKVPVKISVADDFGVDQVQVIFHKLGGAEQVVTATTEMDDSGQVTATAELDLSALDVHDYELVSYQAQAKDNNSLDGPGIGKSPVYFVEINNLEGGLCKKKNPVQKVNLLDIQKQLVADTSALATNAPAADLKTLATRQKDAADFGNIYLSTLTSSRAPEGAVQDMQAAVKSMSAAGEFLANSKRTDALPSEEDALAHLYQVLKQLPELKDMPTQPPPKTEPPPSDKVLIALDAIKKKKEQQPENTRLEDALQQARTLAQTQADLNQRLRKAESNCSGQAAGQGNGQPQEAKDQPDTPKADQKQPDAKDKALAKAQADKKENQTAQKSGQGKKSGRGKGGQGKSQSLAQGKAQGKGQGQGQGQGQGKGKGKGQGQGQGQGQGTQPPQDQETPPAPEQNTPEDQNQLAQDQQELSKEVNNLADKLQRLAGHDKRLGRNTGQNAHLAGQKLATATDEVKKGNFGSAGVNGYQGEVALREVVTQLEKVLHDRPELTDVASEDAPKEYEPLISEYFRKLSHAE